MSSRSVLDLHIGEVGFVKSFGNLHCACKFLSMGLHPTSSVVVIRKSPFGDALYLQLENQKIAIRLAEGREILLEDK